MSLRKFPHARRFPRVYLHPSAHSPVMASWDEGKFLPVYDVSHTGLAVMLPRGAVPAQGEDVLLRLRIPREPEIVISATVARVSDIIVGFEFAEVDTEARVALERFLSAKVRGLHLRRIDPSVFVKEEGGERFTHWFQGPADTNVVLWYESLRLTRAKVEIGEESLEWEIGPEGERLEVLRAVSRSAPFVTRVLDMLSQVHDEEKVLLPLFEVLSRSEDHAS